jgi:hypothetical protein
MLQERKHLIVLSALVAMLVAQPLLAPGAIAVRHLHGGLLAAVLLGVVFTVFGQRWERGVALALVLPAIAIEVAHIVLPDRPQERLALVSHAFIVAFVGFAVTVILRDILRKRVVRGDDVFGAISGYLLVGILWANFYVVAELLAPDSFSVAPEIAWQLREWGLRRALFTYFSFATMTSLGYNDITSVAPMTDTLTWLEVIFAQFYMAVVVAQLVGMKLAQAITPDSVEPK